MHMKFITFAHNHRMEEVWKGALGISNINSIQGQPEQVGKLRVQSGFRYLQGWSPL